MKTGIFATIYGPSKTGKSVCTGAVGATGLFIANPGGLLSVQTYLGLEKLKVVSPTDVESAAKIIQDAMGKYPTIVVDDFSLMVDFTVRQLEKDRSGWDMWRALRAQVMMIRDVAREATVKGTHVIFNCHESPQELLQENTSEVDLLCPVNCLNSSALTTTCWPELSMRTQQRPGSLCSTLHQTLSMLREIAFRFSPSSPR